MSRLDRIYEEVPLEERICEGCGQRIKRNVALIDGRLFHWGCFKKTKAEPTHRCLECHILLTRKGLSKVYLGRKPMLACGSCGSTHLKTLIDRSTSLKKG